jgi:hypothetical protein
MLLTYLDYYSSPRPHPDHILTIIPISIPGIPIRMDNVTAETVFHVCRFVIQDDLMRHPSQVDDEYSVYSAAMFESSQLCHQWMLELLIPFYSKYIESKYSIRQCRVGRIVTDGQLIGNLIIANSLQDILVELDNLFSTKNESFVIQLTFTPLKDEPNVVYLGTELRKMIIQLVYVPARFHSL